MEVYQLQGGVIITGHLNLWGYYGLLSDVSRSIYVERETDRKSHRKTDIDLWGRRKKEIYLSLYHIYLYTAVSSPTVFLSLAMYAILESIQHTSRCNAVSSKQIQQMIQCMLVTRIQQIPYWAKVRNLYFLRHPRQQGSWGKHGAHLGPTGPRWALCWPHETCYLGRHRFWPHGVGYLKLRLWCDLDLQYPSVQMF